MWGVKLQFSEMWQPSGGCKPREEDSAGNLISGCPIWMDANNPPKHEDCKKMFEKGACFYVEFFCQNCKQWEKGCNPAGKPKLSARTRYLLRQYSAMRTTNMPFSSKIGSRETPAWILNGFNMIASLASEEERKLREKLLQKGRNCGKR